MGWEGAGIQTRLPSASDGYLPWRPRVTERARLEIWGALNKNAERTGSKTWQGGFS